MSEIQVPIKKKINLSNLIISGLGIFFFFLAIYMIYKQMSKYSLDQVMSAVQNIPMPNLFAALGFVVLSYSILMSYDYLALRYIGRKSLPFRWMLAGFSGFAVSNNAGHAIVSGTAIRYHLYKRWGFSGPDILKMVTFSTLTYTLGCFLLLILGYILTPNGTIANVSRFVTVSLVIISIVALTIYIFSCLFVRGKLTIGSVSLEFPNIKLAISQIIIGSSDVLLASLVLYSVLSPFIDLSFGTFIGVFLIAQTLGVFSQVPGGMGIFESIFFYVLSDDTNSENLPLIAALIVYRLFYYVLPLIVAFISIFIYEVRFRKGRRRILQKWKLKLPFTKK